MFLKFYFNKNMCHRDNCKKCITYVLNVPYLNGIFEGGIITDPFVLDIIEQ